MFAVRQRVNDAFFAAASLEQRANALAATLDELAARLRETSARAREGTARADAAAVEATLLQRRQDDDELRANRRAALARLSKLTGQPLGDDDVLELPAVAPAVEQARRSPESSHARPDTSSSRARGSGWQPGERRSRARPPHVRRSPASGRTAGLNFIDERVRDFESRGEASLEGMDVGASAVSAEALVDEQQIVDAEQRHSRRGIGEARE